MKKAFLIVSIFFFVQSALSQSKTSFELGLRFRPPNIVTSGYAQPYFISTTGPISTGADDQLPGFSLLTGVEHKFTSRFSASYLLATRYGTVFNYLEQTPTNVVGLNEMKKGLIFDHILGLHYKILKRKKYHLSIGFGVSSCNKNTTYSYYKKYPIGGSPNNDSVVLYKNLDFDFVTTDFPIILTLHSVKFSIIPSLYSGGANFEELNGSQWMLLNLSAIYSFDIPKKKVSNLQ